ncbi:hypothetical protein BJX66DRAFT_53369 [Aspergillus keveii]|uniref:SnoaL-like domain-containing protein n=1 Tax=Aspergillus keveii TaxID=714993 RepID=A0ABR4FQX4_9EURO
MSLAPQTEQNRRTVARYWDEVWTKGNVSAIDDFCADDFKQFYPLHGAISGKENVKKMLSGFRESFPNLSFTLLLPIPLIAENDYVVARWIGGGKHTGVPCLDLPLGGLPVPNSGREMRFSGTTIFTLRDGKIVDEVGEESGLLALQQLGLLAQKKK